MLESGSRFVRWILEALIRLPSLPDRPIAKPPALLIAAETCLLMAPARTISTTSTVSASVTRSPSMKDDFIFMRSNVWPICGPPPWTTIG